MVFDFLTMFVYVYSLVIFNKPDLKTRFVILSGTSTVYRATINTSLNSYQCKARSNNIMVLRRSIYFTRNAITYQENE